MIPIDVAPAGQLDYRLRPALPEDGPAIVDLLNGVFGDWGDLDLWRWKYNSPPASFRIPSMVAELDGQLVGHYGMLPLQGVWHAKHVRAAQTVDAAVLPAHRRRGIHSSLARLALRRAVAENTLLIYAFPGLLSLEVDRRFGQEPVMFVPEMVRVLDWRRALVKGLHHLPGDFALLWRWLHGGSEVPSVSISRLARLRRSLLVLCSWLSSPVWSRRAARPGPDVQLAESIDGRYDRFCERLVASTELGLLKDSSYLNWRYLRQPERSYQILEAVEDGELVGYAVLRPGGSVSDLCELAVLPGQQSALLALTNAAIQIACDSDSLALVAWMPEGQPAHEYLQRVGFISQRRLVHLARRWPYLAAHLYQVTLYAELAAPTSWKRLWESSCRWSLAMGDSDLV